MTPDEVIAPDLHSISVVLEPVTEAVVSQVQGYQAYAMFQKLLGTTDAVLVDALHKKDGYKPFTVSPLQGKFGRSVNGHTLIPKSKYFLRLTFLKGYMLSHFLDAALKWGEKVLNLGAATLRMQEIQTFSTNIPFISSQSYQSILDHTSGERQIELEFLTPTAFRSGGKRNVVFPEPALVFGSYLNRWREFSPVPLDDSVVKSIEGMVVARYNLETSILKFNTHKEVGFTGRCRFELDGNTPEEGVHAVNALADFSFYCGTGAKTTMGMGQTRRTYNARARMLREEVLA